MFKKSRRNVILAGIVILSLAIVTVAGRGFGRSAAPGLSAPSGVKSASQGGTVPQPPPQANGKFINGKSYKNDVSPPLRNMKPQKPVPQDREEERENPPLPIHGHTDQDDPVVQRSFRPSTEPSAPSPSNPISGTTWEGINQAGGCGNCAPPDTHCDVGPNHYVQTVNSSFAVYSKNGMRLYPPTAPSAAINTIWQGFGGACQ